MNPLKQKVLHLQDEWVKRAKTFLALYTLEAEVFAGLAILLLLLGRFPYINIVLTKYTIILTLIVSASLLFRIRGRALLLFTMGLFVVALFFALMGKGDDAESIGNIIYIVLWFVVFYIGQDVWKQR